MDFDDRATKKQKLSHDGKIDTHELHDESEQNGHDAVPTSQTARIDPSTSIDSSNLKDQHHADSEDSGRLHLATPTKPTEVATSTGNLTTQRNGVDNHESQDIPSQQIPPEQTKTNGSSSANTPQLLSKSQQKKLRKQQEWESKREERKAQRKEKQTAKRQRQRAERNPQDQSLVSPSSTSLRSKPSPKPRATQLPITILIDCSFDDLMRSNERVSLAAQITRCYSDNRKSRTRAHLAICAFGGELRERFEKVLTHHKGWRGVKFLEEDFVAAAEAAKAWMRDPVRGGTLAGAFADLAVSEDASLTSLPASAVATNGEKASEAPDGSSRNEAAAQQQAALEASAEIVYLTSEANETLTALRPYSTYIVGGLVDKNREKGICYKRARERGVRTARLPIGEFMEMQSRKVLATNHVCEIMLKWLECGDWGKAFVSVIPKRKGGKLKDGSGADGEEDGKEDDRARELEDEDGVDGDGDDGVGEDDADDGGDAASVEGNDSQDEDEK